MKLSGIRDKQIDLNEQGDGSVSYKVAKAIAVFQRETGIMPAEVVTTPYIFERLKDDRFGIWGGMLFDIPVRADPLCPENMIYLFEKKQEVMPSARSERIS